MGKVPGIEDSGRTHDEFGVDPSEPGSPLEPKRPPFDPDAVYTARRGPRFELVKEEIAILKRFSDRLEERVTPETPNEERKAAAMALLEEDEELAAEWDRLQEIARGNDESIYYTLQELQRKELEEEGGEPSSPPDS